MRCSRCKEAFFLPHPSASRSEVVDAVAGQAAAGGAARAPEAAQDLSRASEVRRSGGPRSAHGSHAGSDEVDNEDEWVFNEAVPSQEGSEEDLSADPEAFDRAAAEGSSGLSLAGEDAESASDSEAKDESVFGSVDDFSSLVGDEASSGVEEDGSLREALIAGAAAPPQEATETTSSGDDLGDPESWDFFGDESLEGARSRPAPNLEARRARSSSRANVGEPDSSVARDFDAADYADGAIQTAFAVWTAHAGRATGWVVTILLVVMGLVTGLGFGSEALVRSQPALDLSGLRADSVEVAWLETARSGRLLVVTAELRNPTARSAAPERMLEVALLDVDGRPLSVAPASVGLALPEADMRELPRRELLAAQDAAARALAGTEIAAGGQITVQALFSELPESAGRFVLRPSGRSPEPPEPAPAVEAPLQEPVATAAQTDPVAGPLLDP